MKNILILGASPNTSRFSHQAIKSLVRHGYEVHAIGKSEGIVSGIEIEYRKPMLEKLYSIDLYLNPNNQEEYYEYIIQLRPKRVIFNPGTENPHFEQLIISQNIDVVHGCTLVMVNTGIY